MPLPPTDAPSMFTTPDPEMVAVATPHEATSSRGVVVRDVVLLAVTYAALASLGHRFAALPGGVTPVWPAIGLAVGVLLLRGPHLWPGVTLGSIIHLAIVDVPVTAIVALSVAVTLKAYIITWLLDRNRKFDRRLNTTGDVLRLALWGAVVGSVIGATLVWSALALTGLISIADSIVVLITLAVGDMFGVLVVTPLVLLAPATIKRFANRQRIAEVAFLLAALAATHVLVYGDYLSGVLAGREYLAVFPVLVYAALRFQVHGAAFANAVTGFVGPIATAAGSGPFANMPGTDGYFALDGALFLVLPTTLLMGILVGEQQRSEVVARQNARRYRAMVENSPVGIAILDESGRIIEASQVLTQVTGHPRDDLRGRPLPSLADGSSQAAIYAVLGAMIQGENPVTTLEVPLQRADGTPMWARLVVNRMEDPEEGQRLIASIEDATHAHEAQLAAEHSKRQADHIAALVRESEWRARILNVAAHEMRTPLTPIMIQAGLLAGGGLGPLTDQQLHALNLIHEATDRLQRLIRDILDVSRIEHGRLEIRPTSTHLAPIITAAMQTLAPSAERKGVTLVPRTPGSDRLRGDPDRLAQVIYNCLTNAIRHSPKGGAVHVTVQADVHVVEIVVTDEGPGVAPEFLETIYRPYVQGHAGSPADDTMGIGLFVARGIVEQHGGTMWSENRPEGAGLVTTVRLPRAGPAAQDAGDPPPGATRRNRTRSRRRTGTMAPAARLPAPHGDRERDGADEEPIITPT